MLRISRIDSRQPLHAFGEVFVGIGPILRPPARGSPSARNLSESAAKSSAPIVLILDAQKVEFGVRWELGFWRVRTKASKAAESLRKGHYSEPQKAHRH